MIFAIYQFVGSVKNYYGLLECQPSESSNILRRVKELQPNVSYPSELRLYTEDSWLDEDQTRVAIASANACVPQDLRSATTQFPENLRMLNEIEIGILVVAATRN